MSFIISISRIILPLITVTVIVKCLISLLFGRPRQNIIAHILDKTSGEKYELNMWETAVGRSRACDIALDYPTISKFHAVITRRVDGWFIYDLYSKNGIMVNGQIVEKKSEISNGDIISLSPEIEFDFIVDNDPIIKVSKKKLRQMKKEAQRRQEEVKYYNPNPETNHNEHFDYHPNQTNQTTVNSGAAIISSDGRIYRLSGYSISIGKGENNSIRILDPALDNVHASIDLYDDGSWVISNYSANKSTYLNNIVVTEPQILIDGDKLKFGHNEFTYTLRA